MKVGYTELTYFVGGLASYSVAIVTTFGRTLWERSVFGPTFGPIVMIAFTTVGGFGVMLLGYGMVIGLGGGGSFAAATLMARIMRAKQIVEVAKVSTKSRTKLFIDWSHWVYVPLVVFICALGLGWDIHNADGPHAEQLQPVLRALDVFTRPTSGIGPILFSRQLIPALVILTGLAGIVPALVMAYFEKFKVTGVNAGPFHTSLLLYAVGALAGLGAILTLLGLVYKSLWLNRAPLPYHFGILAILGFSLHFSLGLHLGVARAEVRIMGRLRKSKSGRLTVLG
jgi:hypothetical protein